jgi:hypothetical protein
VVVLRSSVGGAEEDQSGSELLMLEFVNSR